MDYEELCKAFREEEVKTKHAKRKAQKKAEAKRTRAVKKERAGHEGTSSRADIE